jgi:DNA-binding YbaB/EbfC family protein
LKQAAEMQTAVQESQAALADATFEGTAGGGVVRAVVSGSGDLLSVEIDPSVLDPDDPEMVGDLVVAAVAQAMEALRERAASSLGLGGPGGLDPGSLGDLGGLLG